ncbi:TonB-dependent receptor [Pedobacter gandavensis]|uniref:TonB-dependent receptor plug domain-containing protein n=1 Tax=Pedobacter gandavensis TaxID=2679963 RepID=A0ABR6F1F7_9SPHI|nr:TonB-dependent receptor [Pedobacter gandavensis]MBB2151330.1 TonB-dependent receptor plug domain-containing protein [Pedobacter gandavensis]
MLKSLLASLFLLLSCSAVAQKVFLSGLVKAEASKMPVSGAIVYFKAVDKKVTSDENGYFTIAVEKGEHQVLISHSGFQEKSFSVLLQQDETQTFYVAAISELKEVTISRNKASVMQSNLNNFSLLKQVDLEKAPGFLGVNDVIKTIQTLPGSANGGEGNAGLFVRGGGSGQNLVLFNHAVIYNPSHLLGFFSVFNSDAVGQVKFYKSGIPAEYGGRLSSVVDIQSDQQIADSLLMDGELSVLAAKVNLKIPITSKWSIATTMRKTFMNYSVWPIVNKFSTDEDSGNKLSYDFYDLNFSTAVALTEKDKLFAAFYIGGDDFGLDMIRFNIANGMKWQNIAASLKWNRMISNKLNLETVASYSGYRFSFGLKQEGLEVGVHSAITDFNYSSTLKAYFGAHQLKAGLSMIQHKFVPNTPSSRNNFMEFDYGKPNTYLADETAAFLSDDFKFSDRLSVYAGLRMTYYRHKGPYSTTASNGMVGSVARGKTVSDTFFMEPGLTVKYHLNRSTALKFAYSRNVQTIHLIPISASNFPSDFWIPSISEIPPEKGHQYSLGIFKEWADAGFEGYVDLYLRDMKNIVEFSGGLMNLSNSVKIEDHVFLGKGSSYGSEFYLKKTKGKFTGHVSYTISKSDRTFEGLNEGYAFPFKYDRTHDLTVVSNYRLRANWSLSALFTLATGNAYTKPISRYLIAGNVINEYGAYNAARMPTYHRMDLSATHQFPVKGMYQSFLSVSVYNVYSRKNPIFNFYVARGSLNTGKVSIREKSIALLPILPSINYKIVFK